MYLFICHTCGEYYVTEQTFRSFCLAQEKGKGIWNKIHESIVKGATAVIEFKDYCPKCCPQEGESEGTVSIRWPKKGLQA